MNRNLARGWMCWMPKWAEWRRKKDAMTRGLKHMLNRDLSRGFGAWVEMREERLAFMQTLRKGPLVPRQPRMCSALPHGSLRCGGVTR